MRLLMVWFLLSYSFTGYSQRIDAISEDSSRHRQFHLGQGVECEVSVNKHSVVVRGKLALIEPTGFRLLLGPGYYTTILLTDLIRIRRHRYRRQHLAGAGLGSSLLGGGMIGSPSLGSAPLIAVSALTGLGIALASESSNFRRRDPSIYQGWSYRSIP